MIQKSGVSNKFDMPVGGCVVHNEFPCNAALLSQYSFICHCCTRNVVAACYLKCEVVCGGLEVQLYAFLTAALDGGQ
jgi:hypothetical protein